MEVARCAAKLHRSGVIAFGMGGDELAFPAVNFRPAFDFARSEGLRTVCHAGEIGGPESVREAVEILAGEDGIVANHLHIRWIVPFHAAEISRILGQSKHVIIVENSYSGQFARYLRSETGFDAHGHIRKYDGEPFMSHHIVEAVKEQLTGKTRLSVPIHEVLA